MKPNVNKELLQLEQTPPPCSTSFRFIIENNNEDSIKDSCTKLKTERIHSSPLLSQVRSFLPKIRQANESLPDNTSEEDHFLPVQYHSEVNKKSNSKRQKKGTEETHGNISMNLFLGVLGDSDETPPPPNFPNSKKANKKRDKQA